MQLGRRCRGPPVHPCTFRHAFKSPPHGRTEEDHLLRFYGLALHKKTITPEWHDGFIYSSFAQMYAISGIKAAPKQLRMGYPVAKITMPVP